MTAEAHWHGYGPWTGSHTLTERSNDHLRRPGPEPNDPATAAFLQNTIPPLENGHYLLRRAQTARDRTWTDVNDAMNWLCETYQRHPPDPEVQYGDPEQRLFTTREGLVGGSDAIWHYTTSYSGDRIVVFAVICCPHRHKINMPCPLPPR